MADTSVKFVHSAMSGAPALAGQAGSMIGLLDAILVNGFGLKSVDSLVVAGGVATMTISTGHSFEPGAVALVAGSSVTGGNANALNGEKKVASTTTTTVTFDATGVADQTATGTITAKVAPMGWTKEYAGTNLAVYKSSDVTSTGCRLRVDDTGTTSARVVGYETMSDVNTGTGAFPTNTQQSGGLYWMKSDVASSATRPWIAVGDGKIFYIFAFINSSTTNSCAQLAFGDPLPTKSTDAYHCIISGGAISTTVVGQAHDLSFVDGVNGVNNGLFCPRSYTGVGAAVAMRKSFPLIGGGTGSIHSGAGGGLNYPNAADGGLYVVPCYATEHAASVFRSTIPGLLMVPQNVNSAFASKDIVTGVTGYAGKILKAVQCGGSGAGVFFVDTTGPWR